MKIFWLGLLAVSLSSCYVFKAYKFRKFELTDLHKFDAVGLPASPTPFSFAYDTSRSVDLRQYLDNNLATSGTYAFLVIQNDTILYERYFGNVKPATILPSFSVAKSFTGTLVGIALQEGYIKSLQEPIVNYLPQLLKTDKRFANITIQHVLDMRSGVESNESYTNPFSDVLKLGFASNVTKPALKTGIEAAPGRFEYKSVNTQLLALIVEQATGRKLYNYAIEKLWKPLGMEYVATWNADKDSTVRAFCCINAAARDYAKFGRLYLNNGNWQGRQLISADWVRRSTAPDTMKAYNGYKNQWWAQTGRRVFEKEEDAMEFVKTKQSSSVRKIADDNYEPKYAAYYYDAYHAAGLLGQYIYINPEKKLVIVRMGHNWSHPRFYAQGFIYDVANRF